VGEGGRAVTRESVVLVVLVVLGSAGSVHSVRSVESAMVLILLSVLVLLVLDMSKFQAIGTSRLRSMHGCTTQLMHHES